MKRRYVHELERKVRILRKEIACGEMDKHYFLMNSLEELAETLKEKNPKNKKPRGINGKNFGRKDGTFREILYFINTYYPNFNTAFYEELYDSMIECFEKPILKQKQREDKKILANLLACNSPDINPFYMEAITPGCY